MAPVGNADSDGWPDTGECAPTGEWGSSSPLSTVSEAPLTGPLRLWKLSWEAGSVASSMSFYDLSAVQSKGISWCWSWGPQERHYVCCG